MNHVGFSKLIYLSFQAAYTAVNFHKINRINYTYFQAAYTAVNKNQMLDI